MSSAAQADMGHHAAANSTSIASRTSASRNDSNENRANPAHLSGKGAVQQQQPRPPRRSSSTPQPSFTEAKGHPRTQEHFSLKTWIRQQPWKQYFKDGCKLIVKSPLNFFIFFCCLSVVVWGAFLVLLMGNLVKLKDSATQKIWIEVASQVLNGFFTLANVPVHPKRLLGFVRGVKVWREDKAIQQEFLDAFWSQRDANTSASPLLPSTNTTTTASTSASSSSKVRDHHLRQELLGRLEFYRCFPDYGKERAQNTGHGAVTVTTTTGSHPTTRHRRASRADATVVVAASVPRSQSRSRSRSPSLSRSRSQPESRAASQAESQQQQQQPTVGMYKSMSLDNCQPSNRVLTHEEHDILQQQLQVGIREEDLNELLTEETERVVHSVVLPFLPFPFGGSDTTEEDTLSSSGGIGDGDSQGNKNSDTMMEGLERGLGGLGTNGSTWNSRPRMGPQRGSSATLSRIATHRTVPRTRARTMTLSMTRGDSPVGSESPTSNSTFVFHHERARRRSSGYHGYDAIPVEATTTAITSGDSVAARETPYLPQSKISVTSKFKGSTKKSDTRPPSPPPQLLPMPAPLTQEQIEWVDKRQAGFLKRQQQLQRAWPWYNYTIPQGIEPVDFFEHGGDEHTNNMVKGMHDNKMEWLLSPGGGGVETTTIMLVSLPSKLLVQPSRFCLIVGSFNLNSMIQEILCGFMWGMNYLVRPGWVVGTGMAFGCLAAIIPSVLIMLHESAMSKVRVVATTEEVIQKAIDEQG
ncbi:hypothetical protein BG004_004506 [Podila humilis]|nr:hypothetical protein BG004_004506 [Podila humilis]